MFLLYVSLWAPAAAVAQDVTPIQTFSLTGSDDYTNVDLSQYEVVVDEGLIFYDTLPSDDVDLQVYHWVDGVLEGPYGLVGETQNGFGIGGVARDGDRLAVSRYNSLETFLWSEADQAFVYEGSVDSLPWGYPRAPVLTGDHIAVSYDPSLFMYEWDGSAWRMLYEEALTALAAAGHDAMWLQPPTLRMASLSWDFDNEPAARVYTLDGISGWQLTTEQTYEEWWPSLYDSATFAPSGAHLVRHDLYCSVFSYEPDGNATRFLGRLEMLDGRACDDVTRAGTDRWAAATTIRRSVGTVSIVDMASPEPYLWAELTGAGRAPRIQAYGWLDDTHMVTFDRQTFLNAEDIGHVVVWEMSGPPVLQRLAATGVEEGGSVPLASAVYVMDPDHDLSDVTITVLTAPTRGTLALDGTPVAQGATVDGQAWRDGRVTYDHDGTETVSDALAVEACDPDGACSERRPIDVAITPVNDAPIPTDDTLTVAEGGEGLVDVLANDTDADSVLDLLGVSVAPPPLGSAAVQTDGLRFAHDGSEPGADPVLLSLTVCDPEGACSPSTVAVTVTPVNDPPEAIDDVATVEEGGQVRAEVLANDLDPDDSLSTDGILTVLSGPVHGTAVVVVGALEVQHDGAEVSSDTVVYEVCDAAGACARGTLALVVTPVNDAPRLVDDALVVDEGGTATLRPLGNDGDADGTIDPSSLTVTPPQHGTVTVAGEALTYVHDGSQTPEDRFTYRACDDLGACSEAVVDVVVLPVAHPPVAAPDAYAVDGELVVDAAEGVLANDRDLDSVLRAELVSGPAHGTLTLAADGGFTYLPDDGFTGADAFVYAASDGEGSSEAEVVLAVATRSAATRGPLPDGVEDASGGCGCASAGGAGWLASVPVVLVAIGRRRSGHTVADGR